MIDRSARAKTTTIAAALAAALLLAACGGDGKDSGGNAKTTTPLPTPAGCTADTQMDHYSDDETISLVHTDSPGYAGPLKPAGDPVYPVNPPSGGDHLSVSVPPGLWEADRLPPDGALVHTLEHGYVIIWFKPNITGLDRQALLNLRNTFDRDALMVERTDMPTTYALTAWGKRLLCSEVEVDVFSNFIEVNRNQAPEKIPH